MALVKVFVCVGSVLLVACGSSSATWPRSRSARQTGGTEGTGGTGRVRIVENRQTSGKDGSYSYGWVASDGSYRQESRSAVGEVYGEFGYTDAAGDIVRTRYGANTESQFGFEILSDVVKKRNPQARKKVHRRDETKQETLDTDSVSEEINEIANDSISESNKTINKNIPVFKVINGRRAIVDKRARQLVTKEDIIKNRKAIIDMKAKKLLEKVDKKENINGKKVKIVRKSRKQNVKIMKNKPSNLLQPKTIKDEYPSFEIQLPLPRPILMKPRSIKPPQITKDNSSSRVPYFTAFIKSRQKLKI